MILTQFYRGALAALITVGAMQAQGYFFDDFSSGLIDWDTTGDVGVEAEEAVLRDGQATFSLLYQPVPLPLGTYTIEVDVRHDISPVIPTGQLPDVFFASMYFVDDPSSSDLLGGSIDGGVPLFDLAAGGFANVLGQVDPSAKGAEWSHYTGTFELAHAYAIPTFELNDDNAVAGDSQVRLDNLRIALIPEPTTILLAVVGVVAIVAARRRSRS